MLFAMNIGCKSIVEVPFRKIIITSLSAYLFGGWRGGCGSGCGGTSDRRSTAAVNDLHTQVIWGLLADKLALNESCAATFSFKVVYGHFQVDICGNFVYGSGLLVLTSIGFY